MAEALARPGMQTDHSDRQSHTERICLEEECILHSEMRLRRDWAIFSVGVGGGIRGRGRELEGWRIQG